MVDDNQRVAIEIQLLDRNRLSNASATQSIYFPISRPRHTRYQCRLLDFLYMGVLFLLSDQAQFNVRLGRYSKQGERINNTQMFIL